MHLMRLTMLTLICANVQAAPIPQEAAAAARAKLGSDSTEITPRMVITGAIASSPATYSTGTIKSNNAPTSIPRVNVHSCSAYRGQYDIDLNAVGSFTITTEGNPSKPNYGQIISTNTSGCYQPCTPTNVATSEACTVTKGAHWSGTVNYNTYSSCSAGGYLQAGPRTYISDNCTMDPPTCVVNSWGNTYSCPAGWTGTLTSITYQTCPSGSYGTPSIIEGPATDACVPPASPPPPSTCANGAANFPTCNTCPTSGQYIYQFGRCVDCDLVGWIDGTFASNTTAAQRACFLTYGSYR